MCLINNHKSCEGDDDCIIVDSIRGLETIPADSECSCFCVTAINLNYKNYWEEQRNSSSKAQCDIICKPCALTRENAIAKCENEKCVAKLK